MENHLVDLKEIESVIRSKRALVEYFALKKNQYFPDDSHFTTDFALLVLMGKKKLLTLKEKSTPSIPDIKDFDPLLKKSLVEKLSRHESTREYLPDEPNYKRISKNFIFSLMFSKNRQMFDELYSEYANKKIQKINIFKHKVEIPISDEFYSSLKSYRSNFNEPVKKQFFNVTKNKEMLMNYGLKMKGRSNVINNNVNLNSELFRNNENVNDDRFINQFSNNNNNMIENNINMSNDELLFDNLIQGLIEHIWRNNFEQLDAKYPTSNDRSFIMNQVYQTVKLQTNYHSFSMLIFSEQLDFVGQIFNSII